MRQFSTDVPGHTPIRRRAALKARLNATVYLVDVRGSNGSVAVALWEGTDLLELGADVTIEYDSTIPAWWIVS